MLCVVEFRGGLGNQMFQYALCKVLLSRGHDVKVNISDKKLFCLDKVFEICLQEASEKELQTAGVRGTHGLQKKMWLLKKHLGCFDFFGQDDKEIYSFDEKWIDVSKASYFEGYWQHHSFADMVKEQLCEDLFFVDAGRLDMKNTRTLCEIEESNSVSIHVRRGDYLWKENNRFSGICDLDYYRRAIDYINGKVLYPKFFVFSDDLDWCKENLPMGSAYFVEGNEVPNRSHLDMMLMSRCKHNIIANSSFSYWGAYLNRNPNKIVICPPMFVNTIGKDWNGCPDEWVRM